MLASEFPITRAIPIILALLLAGTPARADTAIDYDTRIEGVDDDTKSALEDASQLVQLADQKSPGSEAALERRARDDIGRLTQAMNSLGFYDARVSFGIAPKKDKDGYLVTVQIEPGQRYDFAKVAILLADGGPPPDPALTPPELVGVAAGAPALAEKVVDAEARIVAAYQRAGWPFAKIARRETVIDIATKTMDVTYFLDVGLPARFGAARIDGLSWLDPDYVANRLKWQQGDRYDQRPVDDTRQLLIGTGLFSQVAVAPVAPVASDGTVPMAVTLEERPLHTIGVGGSYDTNLGIEANVSWQDRDLFGRAENLTLTAVGGQSDSSLTAKFTRPDAFWTNQDFVFSLSFQNQLEEAFRSINQTGLIGFQLHLTPQVTAGYGLSAEHARIDEKIDYRVYTLVGVPLYLRDDETDDLMNPTRGFRAGLELTPYARALGSELTYVQGKLTGSTYWKLDAKGGEVLAARATLGATEGASLLAIPKDHRLFAGGGDTIRGFTFQKAGPWDQYDNPIGGRSLAALSLELRSRISETIGIVPFLDAGSDYPTPLPRFQGKVYMGAGIGLRYFTAIGPIRLDLATPLNPHPVGDSPIQIYVGLGQAF